MIDGRPVPALVAATALAVLPAPSRGADVYTVKPSKVDPSIVHLDEPNVILLGGAKDAPLVLFLTGTGGKPIGSLRFLQVIADRGYKVISLAYDDVPAVWRNPSRRA